MKPRPMNHHPISIKHETITALRHIKLRECGEQMVDLSGLHNRLIVATHLNKRAFGTYARESVARMLVDALQYVPDNYALLVDSAYRSIKDQKRIWHKHYRRLLRQNREWPHNIAVRETNKVVFPYDAPVPPYHSTGGAVDILLADLSGKELRHFDRNRFRESFYEANVGRKARLHRDIVRNALLHTGLTNYPMEYWHWSFGDSGWALRTGNKTAIYGDASWLFRGTLNANKHIMRSHGAR